MLVLTGCTSSGAGSADGDVTLDLVWWGDTERAAQTNAAIEIFEEKNPGITVVTEYQDSAPYRDKLATRFAGGNPPDVMAMPNRSLMEYSERGALADLNEFPDQLDTSVIPESVLTSGSIDGHLYGLATGLTTIGVALNKTVTDDAGITIPNDLTWTWEEFADFSIEISEKTDGKIYGTGYNPSVETYVMIYTRQQGEDFYTEDNKLGVSETTMRNWFQYVNDLRDAGGYPRAGFFEQQGQSPAQSYLALGTIASQFIPVNNFQAYNEASGGNLVLLRLPGETGSERAGYSIDPSQLWSVAAKSEHPEEAALLVDFLTNDKEGAAELLTQRGLPINPDVAESITAQLSADDQTFVGFITDLQESELPSNYVYPAGAATVADILIQVSTELEFGRLTPAEAAKKFVTEATAAIGE